MARSGFGCDGVVVAIFLHHWMPLGAQVRTTTGVTTAINTRCIALFAFSNHASESSLRCSSVSRRYLHELPYVIHIQSGPADRLKMIAPVHGVLASLRRSYCELRYAEQAR
jgi:hypothetical protein